MDFTSDPCQNQVIWPTPGAWYKGDVVMQGVVNPRTMWSYPSSPAALGYDPKEGWFSAVLHDVRGVISKLHDTRKRKCVSETKTS